MILLAGLGNPGKEFFKTRHNIGFEIIDAIHSTLGFPKFSKKFNSLYSKKVIFKKVIIIQKPMSFMNLSGKPIQQISEFYKIKKKNNIIIFHDDLDLIFSKIRIKKTGGHGGHNGIRNIINFIGPDFNRVKFGIKNSFYTDKKVPSEKFVLSKFDNDELKIIETIKKKIITNLEILIKKEFSSFKNNFQT